MIPILNIAERFNIKNRGLVLVLTESLTERTPRPDFKLNVGDCFRGDDDKIYKIKGIEMFMTMPPIVGAVLVEEIIL
jgi:hypothetical protein